MEDKFKEKFGVRAEEYLIEESNGYYENGIINRVLSLVESEPGIMLASSYREESEKFEVIRIIYGLAPTFPKFFPKFPSRLL